MISELRRGRSAPLGASVHADGVNFSVSSKNATGVELLLFDREDAARPARSIAVDPERNRTYHYWHVSVPGIGPGQIYGYRAHGPFQPAAGLRFDPRQLLLDPYGLAVVAPDGDRRDRPNDDTRRAMKSVVADPRVYSLLLLAVGTPMLTMGDEIRRTQRGSNNACQDNDTSWLDWTLLERHRDVHRFAKSLLEHPDVVAEHSGLSLNQLLRRARIEWHGVELGRPDWRDCSDSLAFTITSLRGHLRLHGILNAYWEPLRFELPPPADGGSAWLRWIDTSLPSPEDILPWEKAPAVAEDHYLAQPRSLAFLVAPTRGGEP
jgi:pullulanase/glycogen debranching enzyme